MLVEVSEAKPFNGFMTGQNPLSSDPLSACMLLYNEVKSSHARVQDFTVKPLPSFSISRHCIELIKFSICYGLSFLTSQDECALLIM